MMECQLYKNYLLSLFKGDYEGIIVKINDLNEYSYKNQF